MSDATRPIIKLTGIPIATTKAIRAFTKRSIDKKTKQRPKMMFEVTVLRRFFIHTDVSVYTSNVNSGYLFLYFLSSLRISFERAIALPYSDLLTDIDTFFTPLKCEISVGSLNWNFKFAISFKNIFLPST